MKTLIDYAKSFIGSPYKWGGETPMGGFDCSGLVQEILMSTGIDPEGDQTAQGLYDYFRRKSGILARPEPGALVFYGRNGEHVRHVAFAIDGTRVIEAAGGTFATNDVIDAIRHRAFVRIRPYFRRPDLVMILMPTYPEYMETGSKYDQYVKKLNAV